jgi:hypothetical protein
MRFRTYVALVLGITVPPVLAAALLIGAFLVRGKSAGRHEAGWGELLWVYAALAPAAAAGLQKILMPDFEVILSPLSSSNPHESSDFLRRAMRIFVGAGAALLFPVYGLLCHASGWEKATADWHYSGRNPIGHGLAAVAVELWPFVLLLLCTGTWFAAISVVRTRELDLYWERKSRRG